MADINGVEIFAEGVWNGHNITQDVLKNIVDAFKSTKDFIKPSLKLGHNTEQSLLKNDGLPAAGWVSNVYIRGKKLLADFTDIPDKIFELIKRKAYRKVSVEIFSGYSFDGKTYPTLLGAVALLGADMPAVMTLSDIYDRYKLDSKNFASILNSDKIEITVFTKDVDSEEEKMIDKEQDKNNEDIDKKLSIFQKQLDETKAENDLLKKEFSSYKQESETKISLLEIQKQEAEIEKFSLNLQAESLASPSMLPIIKGLISASPSKSEFSIANKKFSVEDGIKELLKIAKETFSINKSEFTQNSKPKEGDELENKIEEYIKKNNVSYSTAYREVLKTHKAEK